LNITAAAAASNTIGHAALNNSQEAPAGKLVGMQKKICFKLVRILKKP
jgi:hypothetical protein